jgi:cytochrome c peroxidase
MRRLAIILLLLVALAPSLAGARDLRYPQIPPLPPPPRDPANPPTPARRNLGAELFFDQRLSAPARRPATTATSSTRTGRTTW